MAQHLAAHPRVEWVNYPGLPGNRYDALAQRYLPRGAGGILTFGVQGGAAAGVRFIEAVQFLSHLANVGDAKSLVIHPASTTHRQLDEDEQRAAGVSPEMIRLSVGLESLDDILWDLDQALEKNAIDDALRRTFPGPWPALLVCLALLAAGIAAALFGVRPVDRAIGVIASPSMTIGVASLALLLLPPRRVAYLLGFLVCAALMGWALWLQYGDGPRAVSALHVPARRRDRRRASCSSSRSSTTRAAAARGVYAVLTVLVAGAGAGFAARQIWLQALPKDQVPACGMGLNYMLDTLPLADVIARCWRAAASARRKAGCSSACRSPAGRSCSSSR